MPEIITNEHTHKARVSWWDSRAETLCGKTIELGHYRTPWFYGGTDCVDCKKAKAAGKRL
ncbi:hypothetical protein E1161_22620 [Saccharopolyspora aridisoli]|uniref:Uncharacterized protein n=1 Tax=Saccharopolyspora aridisoli TaxID=2530385 RepID=A0A4V2Y6M5_9PSEU|nr:hypothetical protein [Saccharopolyspora aridisoli]TDC88865.1 hypothetical protein E1161_22620 [Saccharopolyspora aridisoli]